MSPAQRRGAALRVVASLSAAYFISQFFRSANAVIAPELMRDLGLAPRALGLVTGAFFLAFGAFQIPVGVLLDRYGPRRVVSAMFVFAVAGALVFAAADTALGLALGRALMGVGCASAFMGGLVACARWFPSDRFAMVSASILAVGGTGALLSTTPLAFATETVGWRGAFVAMAALTALVAGLVYATVRDAPPAEEGAAAADAPARETLRGAFAGLREVFASPQIPGLLAMGFVAYPVFATVTTLWAGPYLADVYGLDPVARGNALAFTTVAALAGTLGYGPLDRLFDSRKRVVIGGALATFAVLVVLAAAPRLAAWQAVALLTLFGAVGVYSVMVLTHGRASFPDRLVGRAVTTVNLAGFVGVALFQAITGTIIEAFAGADLPPGADPAAGAPIPAIAYRAVFAALAATILVALFLYRRTADARPSAGPPRG